MRIDDFDIPRILVYSFGVVFWLSVYYFGFFQTILWTVVVSAVIGIILNLKGTI